MPPEAASTISQLVRDDARGGPRPSDLKGRSRRERKQADDLRTLAQTERAIAVMRREESKRNRGRSIHTVWRARRLVYDQFGPILAMASTDREHVDGDARPSPAHVTAGADAPVPNHRRRGARAESHVHYPVDVPLSEFVFNTIDRMFCVGTSLASVMARLGPGPESDLLASAMEELDLIAHGVRVWALKPPFEPANDLPPLPAAS